MREINNSHELATRMANLADFLKKKPVFELENGGLLSAYSGRLSFSFDGKEQFVAAVKAVGEGTKEYSDPDATYSELTYKAKWAPITFTIPRDRVCKKVVTYDCEPLFSAEEVANL